MIPVRETPVLIVGGGPVGLALAADLGWRGIECVLVEQTDGRINTPKMNEVNRPDHGVLPPLGHR